MNGFFVLSIEVLTCLVLCMVQSTLTSLSCHLQISLSNVCFITKVYNISRSLFKNRLLRILVIVILVNILMSKLEDLLDVLISVVVKLH